MEITISENAISCHPKFVTKRIYTDTVMISGKRLNEINKWLTRGDKSMDFAVTMALGIGVGVAAASIGAAGAPFAVAYSTQAEKIYEALKSSAWGTAATFTLYKLIYKSADLSADLLKSIEDDVFPSIKIFYTFKYVQHGGNDGAFFLTDCKIMKS